MNRKNQKDRNNATNRLTRSVVRVGDGRGFVVRCQNYHGHEELVVITAAHCLPHFPPCHPAMYLEEKTYQRLLGPLGSELTVWAECLFADPIADIAVLGQPDYQDLGEQADAYDRLIEDTVPLAVRDAPAQDSKKLIVPRKEIEVLVDEVPTKLTAGGYEIERPVPGNGPARVLSLDGRWLEGRVTRRSNWLAFEPKDLIVSGMSGSPIISESGEAIGVVSVSNQSPVIADSLSARLLRTIIACTEDSSAELVDLPKCARPSC